MMSDENIRLEYWQCPDCNSIYHIDPLDTIHKVDHEGLVHCSKDKIPMVKLKRKPAKQVPNIGLTNTVFLKHFIEYIEPFLTKDSHPHFVGHIEFILEQLDYSAEWQIKNRRLLDVHVELSEALENEQPLKDFWKSKYLDVEFEV